MKLTALEEAYLAALRAAQALSKARAVTLRELACYIDAAKCKFASAQVLAVLCAKGLASKVTRPPRYGGQGRAHYWLTAAGRSAAQKAEPASPARVRRITDDQGKGQSEERNRR